MMERYNLICIGLIHPVLEVTTGAEEGGEIVGYLRFQPHIGGEGVWIFCRPDVCIQTTAIPGLNYSGMRGVTIPEVGDVLIPRIDEIRV